MQKPGDKCIKCEIVFAKYFCSVCNFYDNNANPNDIYHCEKCGFCRRGERSKTFHCDTCKCCMLLKMKNNHKCMEDKFKVDCPICLENLWNTTSEIANLQCGHAMHQKCLLDYVKQKKISCPLCKKSIVNPRVIEKQMDL